MVLVGGGGCIDKVPALKLAALWWWGMGLNIVNPSRNRFMTSFSFLRRGLLVIVTDNV